MLNLLIRIIYILISSKFSSVFCNTCDSGNVKLQGGILGEVPHFPWLGVLRVLIQQEGKNSIAVTGVVQIAMKFVLVNAADVSKISIDRLRKDATVYFIPEEKTPRTYKPKDIIMHPEYEFATYNSLALLELNLDESAEEDHEALYPICWPGRSFNTSSELYVVGYTDERLLLEKVLYKGQYIAKDMCEEYYKGSSFQRDKMQDPTNYVCAVTSRGGHCQWPNGMLLVSNATGPWTLVGFGAAGPGCSAPARFLAISYYIDWVQSATTDPINYDYYHHSGVDSSEEKETIGDKVSS